MSKRPQRQTCRLIGIDSFIIVRSRSQTLTVMIALASGRPTGRSRPTGRFFSGIYFSLYTRCTAIGRTRSGSHLRRRSLYRNTLASWGRLNARQQVVRARAHACFVLAVRKKHARLSWNQNECMYAAIAGDPGIRRVWPTCREMSVDTGTDDPPPAAAHNNTWRGYGRARGAHPRRFVTRCEIIESSASPDSSTI